MRTRKMGDMVMVDIHIKFDASIPVEGEAQSPAAYNIREFRPTMATAGTWQTGWKNALDISRLVKKP